MDCTSCGASLAPEARFCSSCGTAAARPEEPRADPLRDLLQAALAPNIQIVRPIGRGGMGAVYLGRETALDREVAIKTLAPEVAGAPELRERFRREARIAARLTHPNIVPLHTFGETRDVIFFVMGFVRGESLAERLSRGTVPADEARRILAEIADALACAHERGIVHRDVKPENVLIEDATGKAILTDFGIARMADGTSLTRAGGFIGTPQYMSPEQARGGEVGAASDVYSLGVLGYRMLTGSLPVRSDSVPDLVAKLANGSGPPIEPLPVDLPLPLSEAVMRCLRHDPGERIRAAELRDALRRDVPADEIPDELSPFEGRAFAVFPFLLLAFLLVPFELFLWAYIGPSWRLAILAMQAGAVIYAGILGVAFSEGARLGISRRTVARIVVRQPRWFPGWVPVVCRRPGDFFHRLPWPFRFFRIGATICYVGFVPLLVTIPFALLGIEAHLDLRRFMLAMSFVTSLAMVLLVAGIVFANILMSRRGLRARERSRIISLLPVPKSAWEQPKYAALLLPDEPGAAGTRRPARGDGGAEQRPTEASTAIQK